MKKQYYIIAKPTGAFEVVGPFGSVKDAEKWIREDTRENYNHKDADGLGKDTSCGMRHTIVESVKSVKPVPCLSLKVSLATEKEAVNA